MGARGSLKGERVSVCGVSGFLLALLLGCSTVEISSPAVSSEPKGTAQPGRGPEFAPEAPPDASAPSESGLSVAEDSWTAKNCVAGMPRVLPPGDGDVVVVQRRGYVLAHSNSTRVPLWVSEGVPASQLDGPAKRRNNFRPDPELLPGKRSELADFRGSGFDRGHQAPAEDMTQDQELMDESFFLSNMAPQVGVGFNQHIWAGLEEWARAIARSRGRAWIITGPLFLAGDPPTIGPNRVAVPSHFYKIVVAPDASGTLQAIAFVLENRKHSADERRDLAQFLKSIDWIEERIGVDFMPLLSPEEEERLERLPSPMWN
jgi:endonuclease G